MTSRPLWKQDSDLSLLGHRETGNHSSACPDDGQERGDERVRVAQVDAVKLMMNHLGRSIRKYQVVFSVRLHFGGAARNS